MRRAWAWIENVLRRYPWAITLLAIVPAAYFDASAFNHNLAARLFAADVSALTRPAPPSPADLEAMRHPTDPSHHARDPERILARDIFDADAGCLNCPPPVVPDAVAAGPSATQTTAEACSGQVKVEGAVQVEEPMWSFIFMATGGTQPTLPYRIGQSIDGKTIAQIGWRRDLGSFAMMRPPSGPYCFYAQVMPPRAAPAAPAPGPAVAAAPASGESSDLMNVVNTIERTGPNQFSIRRGAVDRILENQAELMRTTRIMPMSEGGRVVGVQMFGVRDNTLLGRIGMQNGDVLRTINGLDIGSPDHALEAYSRLRTADHISVAVTRNGQPVSLDVDIH